VLARGRHLVLDAVLAGWCGVAAQVAVAEGRVHGSRWWDATLFLLVGWPLLVRRRHPLVPILALGTALVVQALLTWFSPEGGYLVAAGLVGLYSLGAYAGRRALAAGVVTTVVAYTVQTAADPYVSTPEEVWSAAFWDLLSFVALVVGLGVRARRRAQESARALVDAEARQAEAVLAERRRIARDLHDVIAHHVSVSVVQAVAAQGVLDAGGEAVGTPLRRIEASSREAMRELRRMLGLLRDDEGDGAAGQPGLGEVASLVESVRSAGLEVELRLPATPVPEAVAVTAYRVVQEALTNVLKHAEAEHVRVEVAVDDARLTVEVRDDGRGSSPGDPGFGLRGMAERVSVFGGTLHAGPAREGGFRVQAVLPLAAAG
jgi:signal transduction histidine kinase